ncbi:MAG: AAA family ATPase [Planctomycetota bacterium]|nr:AAA family ATPase [Planctomycetota bacterium]
MSRTFLLIFFLLVAPQASGQENEVSIDSSEQIEALLLAADSFYWFGINVHGDPELFNQGLDSLEEAEALLKNSGERKKDYARQIEGLRADLNEQIGISQDTLYGVFPLLRFIPTSAVQYELIDEPDVMAVTRAARSLATTLIPTWRRNLQIDVVVRSNLQSERANRSATLRNEASYVLNSFPKFYAHNFGEVKSILTPALFERFQKKGMDQEIASSLCRALKLDQILEVELRDYSVDKPYSVYQLFGQMFDAKTGKTNNSYTSLGFTKDVRKKGSVLAGAIGGLLVLAALLGLLFRPAFHRTTWITAALVCGGIVTAFSTRLLNGIAPLPEMLVKSDWWFPTAMGASIGVVPILAAAYLGRGILQGVDLDGTSNARNALTLLGSVFLGACVFPVLGSVFYLDSTSALLSAIFLILGGVGGVALCSAGFYWRSPKVPFSLRVAAAMPGLAWASVGALAWFLIPSEDHDLLDKPVQAVLTATMIIGLFWAVLSLRTSTNFKLSGVFGGLMLLLLSGFCVLAAEPRLMLGPAVPGLFSFCFVGFRLMKGRVSEKETSEPHESTVETKNQSKESLDQILAGAEQLPFLAWPGFSERASEVTDNLSRGRPSFLAIYGEVGSGKTRAATEVAARVRAEFGPCRILRGTCPAEGAGNRPFAPFAEAFDDFLGTIPLDGSSGDHSDVLRHVGNALIRVLPVPDLLTGMIKIPESEQLSTSPSAVGCAVARMLKSAQGEGTSGTPIAIIVDDAESIDSSSRQALDAMVEELNQGTPAPVLVMVCFTRADAGNLPQQLEDQGFRHCYLQMDSNMATQFLGPDGIGLNLQLAKAMIERLGDHETARTPRLLVDWTQDALRDGHISVDRKKGVFSLTRGGSGLPFGTPTSLRDSTRALLADLDFETLRVLECASCIGRNFDIYLLAEVLTLSSQELFVQLRAAESAGVLRDVPGQDGTYAFTSSVFVQGLQDRLRHPSESAAPDSLKQVAVDYHKEIAGLLSARLQENQDNPNLLYRAAQHAGQAGPRFREKAATLSYRAAEHAFSTASYADGLCFVGDAIRWTNRGEEQGLQSRIRQHVLQLRILSEAPEELRTDIQDSVRQAQELLDYAEVHGAPTSLSAMLRNQLVLFEHSANPEKAVKLADQTLAAPDVEPVWRVEALHYKALSLQAKGDSEGAGLAFESALQELDSCGESCVGLQSVGAQLLNSAASYRSGLGSDSALDLFDRSLALKEGDLAGQAMTHFGIGCHYLYSVPESLHRNSETALKAFQRNTEINRSIGHWQGVARGLSCQARVYEFISCFDEARQACDESLEIARSRNYRLDYLYAAACKLGILKKMGNDSALTEANNALQAELKEDPALFESLKGLPEDVREVLTAV